MRRPSEIHNKQLLVGRTFRVWEYRVSHNLLVIRSPHTPLIATNVDIFFISVEYFAGPTSLGKLEVVEATSEEESEVVKFIGKPLHPKASVYILAARDQRFPIAAVSMRIEENYDDFSITPINRYLSGTAGGQSEMTSHG